MKRIINLILLLTVACFAYAQDLIVAKQGDPIKAWNIEISEKYVFYTAEPNENAPIQRMAKDNVLLIRKADGTAETLTSAPSPAPTATPVQNAPGFQVSAAGVEANKERVTAYNAFSAQFIGKRTTSKAPRAFFTLGLAEQSVLQDDNLSMDVSIGEVTMDEGKVLFSKTFRGVFGYKYFLNQALQITLTNKTSRTIYIDLANSFYKRGTEASAYYVPTSVASTDASTSGTSIGIPTVFGPVGLSSSKTHAVTITSYSQRIIAIPPRATKTLEAEMLFPKDFAGIDGITVDYAIKRRGYYPITDIGNTTLNIGDKVIFSENNSPVNLGAFITYGFDEAFTQSSNLFVELYARDCIGFPYPSGAAAFCANAEKHIRVTGSPLTFITAIGDNKQVHGIMKMR